VADGFTYSFAPCNSRAAREDARDERWAEGAMRKPADSHN